MSRPKPTGSTLADVQATLRWLDERGTWPSADDDALTRAMGVTLLVALGARTGDGQYLAQASRLGRDLRDPQAASPHAAWALWRLAEATGEDARAAREQARLSGERALTSGRQLDPFLSHAVARHVAGGEMGEVGRELEARVELLYPDLVIQRDRELGLMLWATHLGLDQPWARMQRDQCLRKLDELWVDPPGFFCHMPDYQAIKYADANYLISIGLAAADTWPDRAWLLQEFFRYFRAGDEQDESARTHVLGCCALLPDELILSAG